MSDKEQHGPDQGETIKKSHGGPGRGQGRKKGSTGTKGEPAKPMIYARVAAELAPRWKRIPADEQRRIIEAGVDAYEAEHGAAEEP